MATGHRTGPPGGRRRTAATASPATIRARRAVLLGGVGLLVIVLCVIVFVLARGGGQPARFLAGGGGGGGTFDPLAYDAARQAGFEAGAAAGVSHLIYAKSPGGPIASARRTLRFAPLAAKAAVGGPVDAPTLEAIVMLESAGRPDVIAGADPSAAAGLTQIVAATATQLLGMHVDLPASRRLATQIATASARGQTARVKQLRAARARVDERFDPALALAATERYLKIAKGIFGREDLAIESYHMGIGNLQTALRRFTGTSGSADTVAALVRQHDLSYARLYFDSTPIYHPSTYSWLAGLGDDSSTYLWRIRAAAGVLALYRTDPAGLAATAKLQGQAASAERVLRGPQTPTLATAAAVAGAVRAGALIALPSGAQSSGLGLSAGGPRYLRPEALATALYMAAAVRAIAGVGATQALEMTAATTPAGDLRAAARAGHGRADSDPLHASGYAFDISRSYGSPAEAQAFQSVLDRLSTLNLIAWNRLGPIIHVVVGPQASRLIALLRTLVPVAQR